MELTWIEKHVGDGEDGQYHQHYLVDAANQQCLAIIPEPRHGNILYVTDIRIAGYDRSWMTLEAAKQYCENVAEMENLKAAEELEQKVRPTNAPAAASKQLTLIERFVRKVRGGSA